MAKYLSSLGMSEEFLVNPPGNPVFANSIASEPDYTAHPFLDPHIFQKDRYALRYFVRLFRDHMRNDWHYARLLNRLLHSSLEEHPVEVNERIVSSYCQDASTYVRELLSLLPEEVRGQYVADPVVENCNNLRSLGQLVLSSDVKDEKLARKRSFEAQRKLYLTKLLIQIEHTRMVQDGPRHRRYMQDLLEKELWAYVSDTRDWEARYSNSKTRPGTAKVRYGDEEDTESWHFRVRTIERDLPGIHSALDIYHFDTRFKKEVAGYEYSPGRQDYEVSESPRYGHMKRNRSASILSKMLRKSINDPLAITDMLGAKFIVASERDVHRLADLLHQVLGGPFLFRNQVDLFRKPEDHSQLNTYSSNDFKAFKEDVDILYSSKDSDGGRPYLFSVELQIFTVESFLQTVHSDAYTSHREYKRRQFLQGVVPFVFPESLYGTPVGQKI